MTLVPGTSGALFPTTLLEQSLARNWWALALRGVFGVIFGLIALVMPGVTLWTLTVLFAAYMLMDGVFSIVAGVRAASHRGRWGLPILEGVLDIIAGLVALVMPGLTILVLVLVLGVWAVITGVMEIVAATRLPGSHGRWWLVIAGLVSIVWGILLFLWPAAGAVVLAWWLGAYALVFGIALIIMSLQLRSRARQTVIAG